MIKNLGQLYVVNSPSVDNKNLSKSNTKIDTSRFTNFSKQKLPTYSEINVLPKDSSINVLPKDSSINIIPEDYSQNFDESKKEAFEDISERQSLTLFRKNRMYGKCADYGVIKENPCLFRKGNVPRFGYANNNERRENTFSIWCRNCKKM